ncbi:hypothetical protein [Dongia rigui]|uniref:Glycosyltransferase n=1 Tax=Dongia rigui TaxID=940149 RepID=A0ABU5E2X2_9PROT|nr:hypothetical protein [Dongia rigui]MDY0873652.1 hypothetical protein [Dongia rigui]
MSHSSQPEQDSSVETEEYPASYLDRGFDKVIQPTVIDWGYRARAAFDSLSGGIDRAGAALARKISWNDPVEGRPNVLCLDRAMLRKDVAEMRRHGEVNFPHISVQSVRRPQEDWVPPQWRRQTYIYNYVEEDIRWVRPHLKRFGLAFLRAAHAIRPIHAILAGNMDYWQDEALKLACEELGIPFVALCRENYLWPSEAELVKKQYLLAKFRYRGAAVAVASDPTREALYQTGAFHHGTITTTGWPRFDAWRDTGGRQSVEKDTITLFSYADPLYLAPKNFAQVLECFIALAAESAELVQFVLKAKKPNEVQNHFRQFPGLQGSRVKVVAEIDLPDLISRSKGIIGYNSSAVLEGLLCDTAIVIPFWGDSVRGVNDTTLHPARQEDQAVASFVTDPEQLKTVIRDIIAGRTDPRGDQAARLGRFAAFSHFEANTSSSHLVTEVVREAIARTHRR